MLISGELERIINDTLNKFADKFINILDPDDFYGLDDIEKLQAAINQANTNSKVRETTIIQLNRVYDITGNSIKVNKPVNREKLIITGLNGGIVKSDSGYVFNKNNTDYVTDIEIKDTTIRGTKGTKLFKSPDFINVTINNCKLDTIDTIVDSDTYMQNIHVNNSLITGGNGDLFKACGFYGLFITGNTIEHRKGYVIKQEYVAGNMYDSCYFIDMVHNLIEGFTSGGIAYLKKIHKVNISNNYFESMKDNIMIDSNNNMGALSVDNNRLYVGSGDMASYQTKGLINILTRTYPDIHAHSNKVENCYLINITKGFSINKKINLASNDVNHANKNDDFHENGTNQNHEINTFPLIPTTDSLNKYERTITVISDKKYTKNLTIEGKDVRLSLMNGEIISSVSGTEKMGVNLNNASLYFGVPVFADDLTDVQIFSQNINLMTKYRFGAGNDKYLLLVANNTGNATQEVTVIATMKAGANIRG